MYTTILDDSFFAQALTLGLARRKIYKVVCTAYVHNNFGRQFLCPGLNPQPQQQQIYKVVCTAYVHNNFGRQFLCPGLNPQPQQQQIYKVVCTAYVHNNFGRQFLCPGLNPQPQQQQLQPLSSVATSKKTLLAPHGRARWNEPVSPP